MKYIVYLLSIVLPAIKRVAGDTFVFQRDNAPANRRAKRSNCWSAKPQILSLRICGPPTALTSIWSITRGVGRYVGFTPMWERTICGIRAGELDISPLRGIGNTHTRLHSYG